MATAPAMPATWTRLAQGRATGIVVGVVLSFEALMSPLVWWGTFIVAAFMNLGTKDGQVSWVDGMQRLGSWGPLVLLIPLVGGAVAMFGRPPRPRWLWAPLCLVAALINLIPAVLLVLYNVGYSNGSVGSRLIGVAFGLGFGFVAARAAAEGFGYFREPPVLSPVLPPPPPAR